MNILKSKLLIFSLFLLPLFNANALERVGRLGVGLSQQFKNDIPAIDFKLQRSKGYAMGLLLGAKLTDNSGGWGAGLKMYRIIFEEPLLNFYAAGLLAAVNTKTATTSNTGFQIDATMGSEFSFAGLESVAFSFEFGLSVNKINDELSFETVGNHIVVAGIHFYI